MWIQKEAWFSALALGLSKEARNIQCQYDQAKEIPFKFSGGQWSFKTIAKKKNPLDRDYDY